MALLRRARGRDAQSGARLRPTPRPAAAASAASPRASAAGVGRARPSTTNRAACLALWWRPRTSPISMRSASGLERRLAPRVVALLASSVPSTSPRALHFDRVRGSARERGGDDGEAPRERTDGTIIRGRPEESERKKKSGNKLDIESQVCAAERRARETPKASAAGRIKLRPAEVAAANRAEDSNSTPRAAFARPSTRRKCKRERQSRRHTQAAAGTTRRAARRTASTPRGSA